MQGFNGDTQSSGYFLCKIRGDIFLAGAFLFGTRLAAGFRSLGLVCGAFRFPACPLGAKRHINMRGRLLKVLSLLLALLIGIPAVLFHAPVLRFPPLLLALLIRTAGFLHADIRFRPGSVRIGLPGNGRSGSASGFLPLTFCRFLLPDMFEIGRVLRLLKTPFLFLGFLFLFAFFLLFALSIIRAFVFFLGSGFLRVRIHIFRSIRFFR